MKNIVLLLYFIAGSSVILNGQGFEFSHIPDSVLLRIDEMGNDNSDTLSELECHYFEYRFPRPDSIYNFSNKKIIFIHAHGEGKMFFFSEERRLMNTDGRKTGMSAAIYFFDDNEKQLYDIEYDIVVYCWAKFNLPKEKIGQGLAKSKKY